MKREQDNQPESANKGRASWLNDAQGGLAAGRVFIALFLLTLASAFIASAAGVAVWPTALLMAILATVLVHALIVTPLARHYEINLKTKKPSDNSGSLDVLTRISNRHSITSGLLNAMAYANRYSHPLSVALVDLDLLRNINREMGRKAGDKALQTVAAVFTDTLRMPDHAGRYGDEEFLVLMPNTSLKNATQIAERIRDGVESAECSFNGKKIPLTVSIGASQFHKGEDLERFMARVDKALAAAKVSRNRVVAERRAAAKTSGRGSAERRASTARQAS